MDPMGYGDHSKPNILWCKKTDVPNQQINSGYDGYILGADVAKNDDMDFFLREIWRFPEIGVPRNHPF